MSTRKRILFSLKAFKILSWWMYLPMLKMEIWRFVIWFFYSIFLNEWSCGESDRIQNLKSNGANRLVVSLIVLKIPYVLNMNWNATNHLSNFCSWCGLHFCHNSFISLNFFHRLNLIFCMWKQKFVDLNSITTGSNDKIRNRCVLLFLSLTQLEKHQ